MPSLLKSNGQQAQDSLETGSWDNDSCAEEETQCYNSTLNSQVKTYPYTHALWNWWPCCSVCCMHLFWHNEISVLHPRVTENRTLRHAHTDSRWLLRTLFVWADLLCTVIKHWSEAIQKIIMKYNNKNSLFHIPPLAVCCTPHCISLHETCWNMINSWMSLSLLASLNQ